MPSLDVVSTVDMQALDNAVNNVKREVATRYDFKNVRSEITLDRKGKSIQIITGDESKIKAMVEMLVGQCTRLKVSPRSLDQGEIGSSAHGAARMEIGIKEGIPRETCQKIVKYIKGLKINVQPVMQDDQVRITGKQIDDLREIMRLLTEQDFNVPLAFVNMKS
jgi:uncharacterized protein YajQ (UPF0234 family)